jgi:hypothetical protein
MINVNKIQQQTRKTLSTKIGPQPAMFNLLTLKALDFARKREKDNLYDGSLLPKRSFLLRSSNKHKIMLNKLQ